MTSSQAALTAPIVVGAISCLAARGLGASYAVPRAPWSPVTGAVLVDVAA